MAWQDGVAASLLAASGGEKLSKAAPNTAPTVDWARAWGRLLDNCLVEHEQLLASPIAPGSSRFKPATVVMFVEAVLERVARMGAMEAAALGIHRERTLTPRRHSTPATRTSRWPPTRPRAA